MVTGTASFIALFRPLPRIGLPTRKRAAVVWAASWVLMVIGGALAPEPTPEELVDRAEAERVREEERASGEAEQTPEQRLRSEMISELGRSNRDVNRLEGLTEEAPRPTTFPARSASPTSSSAHSSPILNRRTLTATCHHSPPELLVPASLS